jgi:hypothetical protein
MKDNIRKIRYFYFIRRFIWNTKSPGKHQVSTVENDSQLR